MDEQTIQKLTSTGLHQECLHACQQLLKSEPENPLPWKYAGKSLLSLGQFEKAQQCLTKAHELDNQDPETIKDIGNIFNALHSDTKAIKFYKAALSIDQNYAPALNNLGLIAKRQGDLVAAEQLVKRACELDQSFAPYHMNLGNILQDLGKIDSALTSSIKSIQLSSFNDLDAQNNLTLILQNPRTTENTTPSSLIEKIDIELRSIETPGTNNKQINNYDIDKLIKKSLDIATPLEKTLATSHTQIYHRTKSIEPNCSNLLEFFNTHNSIAEKCHNCYKVQIEVHSLHELIILNFLMKSLRLELNNTRKCMVELREHAKGFYKGIIYCTKINEAKNVAKEIEHHIHERSKIKPMITVKRGCTEFTNAHKEYGEIGNMSNLHQGKQQRTEWKINEEQYRGNKKDITMAHISGLEFNLGELLIIKNWILYALAIGDSEAMVKYKNINYSNDTVSKAIDIKKASLVNKSD